MSTTATSVSWRSARDAPTRASVLVAAYERHHQALYRYCRSIVRHDQDAQDALQSTLTRAFAALPEQPRTLELRPWLFQIAHNEAISILRRRRSTVELDDSLGHPAAFDERIDAREVLRMLRRDIADLPERQRVALVLRELNGLGHAEIAQVLETTPAAVKQAIFDARRTLSHCRDGRALECREVQRMVSDGDGRRLRGRGVRAHMRACPDCRGFQAELTLRPGRLAALAPPLPAGAAAAILAAVQGGAATTAGTWSAATGAKLAIGLILAAGGATAVAPHHRHAQPHRAAIERHAPAPRPERHVAAAAPAAHEPPAAAVRSAPASVPARRPASRTRHAAPVEHHAAATAPAVHSAPAKHAIPAEHTAPAPAAIPAAPVDHSAPARDSTPPGQAKKPAVPPGQAKKPTVPPGQAKKVLTPAEPAPAASAPASESAPAPAVPPGQAKKDQLPPGQAKKDSAK